MLKKDFEKMVLHVLTLAGESVGVVRFSDSAKAEYLEAIRRRRIYASRLVDFQAVYDIADRYAENTGRFWDKFSEKNFDYGTDPDDTVSLPAGYFADLRFTAGYMEICLQNDIFGEGPENIILVDAAGEIITTNCCGICRMTNADYIAMAKLAYKKAMEKPENKEKVNK